MDSAKFPDRSCHRTTMAVIFGVTVAAMVIIAVSLLKKWDNGSFILSLLSFLMIVYVTFTALRANAAQARRDKAGIRNTYALIRQCRVTLDRIDRSSRIPDFEQMHRQMGQLYERIGLHLTKYGDYLQPDVVDIVWDMEDSITDAKALYEKDLRLLLSMLYDCLDAIHYKVLDVNDPSLLHIRSKM